MSKQFDAIKAWNRKHRKNFKAVPKDILATALMTIEPGEEYEFRFCPKCGCSESSTTENMAPYPEQWIRHFCKNCNFLVGEVDNSSYQHCFDYKEENYEIQI